MASATQSVTLIKRSSVAPPPFAASAAAEMSLPLTFLDMVWLHFFPIERLMFYEIPNLTKSHFVDHIIPKLERSLSVTLGNFLPLAGNLIIPSNADSDSMPRVSYVPGGSLTVSFSECDEVDRFGYLTSEEARNCRDFRPFIPELFKSLILGGGDSGLDSERRIPVLAIQVTLFPDSGIAIGIANHHSVGDANTIFQFMKTWTSLNSKLNEDMDDLLCEKVLGTETVPFYDRSIVQDSKGLASIYYQRWNGIMEHIKSSSSFSVGDFLDKAKTNVRKTFVVSREDTEKLKNIARKSEKKVLHLSSFTVTCAYVWTCLVKSRVPSGEEVSEDQSEQFSFYADCRARMDPPLPENYFGNCLSHCITVSEYRELVGEEGFQTAAGLIGKTIHERLKNSETIFSGAEKWMTGDAKWERDVGVAGSPKYNYYDLDFGFGRPIKFEFVSIDLTGAVSLSGCREPGGGIEVGLSLSKTKMDAFTSIFKEGLGAL